MKKSTRNSVMMGIGAATIAGLVILAVHIHTAQSARQAAVQAFAPSTAKIRAIPRLCSYLIQFSDMVDYRDQAWDGDVEGVWRIIGDARVCLDLRRARVARRDMENKQIWIQLPLPEPTQARLDHEQTRCFIHTVSGIRSLEDGGAIVHQALLRQQRSVENAAQNMVADDMDHIQRTFEGMLRSYLLLAEWQAEFSWGDGNLGPRDAPNRLIQTQEPRTEVSDITNIPEGSAP